QRRDGLRTAPLGVARDRRATRSCGLRQPLERLLAATPSDASRPIDSVRDSDEPSHRGRSHLGPRTYDERFLLTHEGFGCAVDWRHEALASTVVASATSTQAWREITRVPTDSAGELFEPIGVVQMWGSPPQPARLSPLTEGASHDDEQINRRDKVKRTSRLTCVVRASLDLAHQASTADQSGADETRRAA